MRRFACRSGPGRWLIWTWSIPLAFSLSGGNERKISTFENDSERLRLHFNPLLCFTEIASFADPPNRLLWSALAEELVNYFPSIPSYLRGFYLCKNDHSDEPRNSIKWHNIATFRRSVTWLNSSFPLNMEFHLRPMLHASFCAVKQKQCRIARR